MSDSDQIKALVKILSEHLVKHRENMFSNHSAANRHFDSFKKVLKRLFAFGQPGLSALATLLDNPRPVVRVSAAMCLISHYPERAIRVLQAELDEQSFLATEALVTLERWKRGIYLDPMTGKEIVRDGAIRG